MIEVMTNDLHIPWRHDRATREYIEEHADELQSIEAMTPDQLADACTYCETIIGNPFAAELTKRAGCDARFNEAYDAKSKMEILQNSAKSFGIILI